MRTLLILWFGWIACGQGSKLDYERAAGLSERWKGLVQGAEPVRPSWSADGKRLYYRREGRNGAGPVHVVVNLADGRRTESDSKPDGFPEADQPRRRSRRRGRRGARRSTTSPDGRWTVKVRDHDLWLEEKQKEARRLTEDGQASRSWRFLSWAPDSSSFLASAVEPGAPGTVINVRTTPSHGAPAEVRTRSYARPGDKMDAHRLFVFDPQEKTPVDAEPITFGRPRPVWGPGGKVFRYERRERGHTRDQVVEVEVATGKSRVLIDERPATFIDHYHKGYLRFLDDSGEILWTSERDGWNHLYLYDGRSGKLKTQVTRGDWLVAGVDHVDTTRRQVWFRALGVARDQDPYHVHYMRVDFDGRNLLRLTSGDGTHSVQFSPDRRYLIDRYSRVDLPPVTELRRAGDGGLVCTLEEADASRLKAAGWRPPERFVAKGRDGKTDIWGIIVRPTRFDPRRSYPVLESVYAGPHDSHVPKRFGAYRGVHGMAELGFVVVQVDGMGTNNRSKAFLDVCWKNIGDGGLPDRRLWIQAAARKYAYLDAARVGIYGTSAGGQTALGALLFHGDFYKAAVASCGCHDYRIDKASWNEQWMGYPVGPHYAAQSNVTNAARLNGKLLLMVGELDTNVPPESTYQVVDALIKADKDFEFIALPGVGHSSGGRYGERRRRDFFVRALLGREPRWDPAQGR